MASMRELAMDLLSRAGTGPIQQPVNVYGQDPDLPIGYGEGEISPLDAAAMSTMLVPGVGDVTGLAADVDMYMRDPESRNIPNYLLTAAGALPFLPAASQVRQGIKAYHGSPYDFDRFSTEQIGTGEGAQAYGQGLYFAESENVAKQYRDQLTPNDLVVTDSAGRTISIPFAAQNEATEVFKNNPINEAKKIVKSEEWLSSLPEGASRNDAIFWSDILAEAQEVKTAKGSMYEVNIDVEPDELLDWDTPLSEQKALLQKIDDLYGDHDIVLQQLGVDLRNAPTGMDLADALHMRRGSPSGPPKLLEDAGIKGVKYADAFTRHKTPDKRSMNYVIFDDRLITIAKKYGIAIPAAAAMLARMTGEDTSQSYQEET
tara:strand:- start:2028 stop:3146 length:1119 start_codon:yes stop_codon:yes gene_type:complete